MKDLSLGPLIAVLLAAVAVGRFTSISPSPQESARRRESYFKDHQTSETRLRIAFVWPSKTKDGAARGYKQGTDLAIAQINRAGGLPLKDADGRSYRRRIDLIEFDAPEEGTANDRLRSTTRLARRIGGDPTFAAVIGHSAKSAVLASVTYDAFGLPFLVSNTTDVALLSSRLVLRVSPDDKQIAQGMIALVDQIARLKRAVGDPKRIAVALLYPSDKAALYGGEFHKTLVEEARKIVQRDSERALIALRRSENISRSEINRLGGSLGPMDAQDFTDIDFQVELTLAYDPDREDYGQVLKPIVDRRGKINVILFCDRLPSVTPVKSQLRAMLAQYEDEAIEEKTYLDFDNLKDLHELIPPSDPASLPSGEPPSAIAQLVLNETREKAVVLYERSGLATSGDAERRLAVRLEEQIVEPQEYSLYRLKPSMSRSYDPESVDYTNVVASVQRRNINYIFVVGNGNLGPESSLGRLIRQLRVAGVDCPILCSPNPEAFRVDVSEERNLWPIYVASTYDPGRRYDDTRANADRDTFERLYFSDGQTNQEKLERRHYESSAAYGWATITILGDAFKMSATGSPQGAVVAARSFAGRKRGVLGPARISSNGGLVGVPLVFIPVPVGSSRVGGKAGWMTIRPAEDPEVTTDLFHRVRLPAAELYPW